MDMIIMDEQEKLIKELKDKIDKGPSSIENYSYHKGKESKNDRINFKHWNNLIYEKEKSEKDTTYSNLWLYRKAKMIPPFTDLIGSSSPSKAKKDGVEYFSEFNPLVSQNITNFWSDEGDVVLDPFAGRTRGIVSGLTHRKYYGFEISKEVYEKVIQVIELGKDKFEDGFEPIIYNDDSFNLDKYKDIPDVDLVFSCPPYWDLEKYPSSEGQLSDIEDYNSFLERFKQIMEKSIIKLKDNGFVCLVVGDFRKNERFVSFESEVIRCLEEIKDIELWDKIILQNINHGWASKKFGSIKHKRITAKVTEYLLVFKKIKKNE
jgi:DNA modification methylase